MSDIKPKAIAGRQKLRPGLIPHHVRVRLAVAMSEGDRKYGEWNWREKPIVYSDYIDALHRHVLAVEAGQDIDPDSMFHHLIKVMSTCGVMLDAIEAGTMIDDRKPSPETVDPLETWRASAQQVAGECTEDRRDLRPELTANVNGEVVASLAKDIERLAADEHLRTRDAAQLHEGCRAAGAEHIGPLTALVEIPV